MNSSDTSTHSERMYVYIIDLYVTSKKDGLFSLQLLYIVIVITSVLITSNILLVMFVHITVWIDNIEYTCTHINEAQNNL